jgi:hypothetical protein
VEGYAMFFFLDKQLLPNTVVEEEILAFLRSQFLREMMDMA